MKKLILTSSAVLLLAAIALIIFSSFKNEIKYSCDPEIDRWVKENKEKFKDISLANLNSYTTSQRLAIYRTLTSQKHEKLWVEKFDNIINAKDGWNEAEIVHI